MYTEKTFTIAPFASLSKKSIEEHKKLYAGYVKNANLVLEKLASYKDDESKAYETAELYRQFSFEFNGMRNHECYFALLDGKSELDNDSTLLGAISAQWGDMQTFKDAFLTLALTRGIGWAMLSYDKAQNNLVMHWVDEQHLGQLQGTTAIIALDMWEHSYVADYQPSGKKQYVTDFIENMNWSAAEDFFARAK
ncbi:MAG TPA: Fe-Mn family superoxide dismutase [Candidatus Paceibacterota bacterium]